MTSSGYGSPVRMPVILTILISTAAAALPFSGARAESVFYSARPSARIHALGSGFAGIIPDGLTDLTLNPARAWDTGALTINYGYRSGGIQDLPFPIADRDLIPSFSSVSHNNTNEIRLYGLNAWGLRWAIDTEWGLFHDDECKQSGTNPLDRSYNGNIRMELRENCGITDRNFFRLDLATAGKIGDRVVLGIRAGGTYSYHEYKYRYRYVNEAYDYDSETESYVIVGDRSWDEYDNTAKKLFTGYIEAGLTWEDSGDLVFRGGYAEGTALLDDYRLETDSDYDGHSGVISRYIYDLNEFKEDRTGNSWKFSGLARKKYSGGIVILAAGAYEQGSYEAEWRDSYTLYSWGNFNDRQINDTALYPGEGNRTRSEAVFRIGKTYSLESRLDLTPGAHVYYRKKRFEESGEGTIDSYMFEDGTSASFESTFPLSFERTDSRTSLRFPLAIEFRPASFFHLYSGFGVTFSWDRSVQRKTFLVNYGQEEDQLAPSDVETDNNHFSSGYYASLGFSLRYREKLFLDMYTGNDIVPDNITHYFIDLRYVF